jgi:hypothetical protein
MKKTIYRWNKFVNWRWYKWSVAGTITLVRDWVYTLTLDSFVEWDVKGCQMSGITTSLALKRSFPWFLKRVGSLDAGRETINLKTEHNSQYHFSTCLCNISKQSQKKLLCRYKQQMKKKFPDTHNITMHKTQKHKFRSYILYTNLIRSCDLDLKILYSTSFPFLKSTCT